MPTRKVFRHPPLFIYKMLFTDTNYLRFSFCTFYFLPLKDKGKNIFNN